MMLDYPYTNERKHRMKPAASSVLNTGTLGGPSKTMTIMRDAMAHIMSVLTNLYSDARMAVLREYATNALDAHREAGVNKPITIVLPTDYKPTLVIEDYGVGMSTDEILNLYSSYGASTKRDTNEQTGMLGLGSKSALAYSPQFTVRSRKGGVETSALIYLNDRGEGEIKIVDTKATTETGTRIEVPVIPKDIPAFAKAAARLFIFWTPEDVEVKGATQRYGIKEKSWTWVTPKIALTDKHLFDSDQYRYRYDPAKVYVVMGGVPYVVDKDRLSDEAKASYAALPLDHHSVVFIADIGSVQFVPSREALYYTNTTNATLDSLFSDYVDSIGSFITAKVAAAKDRPEALRTYDSFRKLVPGGAPVTYKGAVVPSSVACHCFSVSTAKRSAGSSHKALPLLEQVESHDLVIFGATFSQLSDKGAYPLRVSAAGYLTGSYALSDRYYGRNAGQTKNILIISGDLPDGWDWYNVKAVNVSDLRAKAGKGKGASQAKTEYQERVWEKVGASWGATTKVDPADDKVVYVDASGRYSIKADKAPAGWTVVMVPGNQHGRFAREFPLARTPEQVRKEAMLHNKVVLDEESSTYLSPTLFHYGNLTPNQVSEILDPDLRTVLEWKQGKKPALVVTMEKVNADHEWLNLRSDVEHAKTPTLDRMVKRYGAYRGIDRNVLIDTLNAIYTYKYLGGTK
jgi:hypothetical protein